MSKINRLWLCGITQNAFTDIDELTKDTFNLVDGLVWTDHYSSDGTYELLKQRKKSGKIVQALFTKNHDWSMNYYLQNGTIKHGDWVIQCDTSERIHPNFIERLQNGMLENFERQNINTVYQRSKPLLWKFYDDQFFLGSPHWGLQGQRRHAVDISKFDGFSDDRTYFWSLRDDINKWITNGMKYYYVYGRSNHMWLVYNPNNYPNSSPNLIAEHELKRQEFREYCRNEMKFSMNNLNDITDFMISFADKLPGKFIEFMNYEKVIANYFRYVNGEDQQEIYDTQKEWSYKS